MTYEIDFSDLEQMMTPKGYSMLKDEQRYLVSYGGSASSKSYSATQKILYRILTEENHRILCLRKTAKSLRQSVSLLFQDVISSWNLSELFTINKTDLSITCKNGNSIIMSGLDDVEKLKSIAGITSIWIEEASEITFDDFTQIDLRLRGNTSNYKQIILTFNPTSSKSWLKKRFFDNQCNKTKIVHSVFSDNQFLDEDYKKVLENLISQNKTMYDIYALGKWGLLKGLIYPDFTIVDELPDDYVFSSMGCDFGFNHPQALTEVRTIGNDIFVKELFYETETLVTDLIAYMDSEGISKEIPIYADSANPDKIVMIQNAGYKCTQAKKDVLAGIDFMKSKNIHVTKESVNLIKELESYSWKLDKNGEPMEQPVKFNDDLCDSLRYALFRGEKIKLSIAKIGQKKKRNEFDDFDRKEVNILSRDSMNGY